MGLKFRKSFKIAPGVRMNVSSKSVGASVGVKGLRHSVNSRGQSRTTVTIPGTGISSTSSGKNGRSATKQNKQELLRQEKELAKSQELEKARYDVEVFESKIELMHSLHKECYEQLDWQTISESTHPHHSGEIGIYEAQATEKLESFKPNFIQKIFKTAEKEELKLRENVMTAKKQDTAEYTELCQTINLANQVLNKNSSAYLQVIEDLSPLDNLLESEGGFTFIIEDPNTIEVEFNIRSKQVIPTQQKSLTKTGKLSVKEMTKTKYYDILQDYVASCSIRIARDMFAVLPFKTVIVHVMDDILDTSTGNTETLPILSVCFDKDVLNTLNFEAIDCSDSLVNFRHNMKFKKTQGFSAVEKIS